MTVYFIDASGKRTPLTDNVTAAFPIDSKTQRTTGINIGVDYAGPITFKLTKLLPQFTYGPVSRAAVAGKPCLMADGSYPFSAADYKLEITTNVKTILRFKITKASSTPTTPTDPQAPDGETVYDFLKGACGGTSKGPAAVKALFDDLGVRVLRPFITNDLKTETPDFSNYLPFIDAGFLVAPVLTFHEKVTKSQVPSEQQCADWAGSKLAPALKKMGNRRFHFIEFLNEPNNGNYMPDYGSHQEQGRRIVSLMRPVFNVTNPLGQPLASPGFMSNAGQDAMKGFLDAGGRVYCRAMCCHPYHTSASGQRDSCKNYRAIAPADLPLYATEYNLQLSSKSDEAWGAEVEKAIPLIKPFLSGAWYFHATPLTTPAGRASLFTSDYKAHAPFYGIWKAA